MEALLLDAGFQERLKDTRVEGLLLVTTALQPHLPAFAARARAALAPLVEPPGGLPPLSDFSGTSAGRGRAGGAARVPMRGPAGRRQLGGASRSRPTLAVPVPAGPEQRLPLFPSLLPAASFLADITPALASSIVENTLLQSLWQD